MAAPELVEIIYEKMVFIIFTISHLKMEITLVRL